MKSLLLFCLATLFYVNIYAQVEEVAVSVPFEIEAGEYTRLMPLENGNLAMIRFHENRKLNIFVYDQNHKLLFNLESKMNCDKLKDMSVRGAIEIPSKNQILLFFKTIDKNYVAKISTQDGKIESVTEMLGSNPEYNAKGVLDEISISENGKYFALHFTQELESKRRTGTALLFDNTGKKISSNEIDPDPNSPIIKDFLHNAFIVENDGTVLSVWTNLFKVPKASKRYFIKIGLNQAPVYLTFNKSSEKFDHLLVYGLAKYNPIKEELLYMCNTVSFDKGFVWYKYTFDKEGNQKTERLNLPLLEQQMTKYVKVKKTDKTEFTIVNVNILESGSYQFLLEGIINRVTHDKYGESNDPHRTAFIVYNMDNATYSLFPTCQKYAYSVDHSFFLTNYYTFSQLTRYRLSSFSYVTLKDKPYFLFNDNMRLREKIDNNDKIALQSMSIKTNLDGFYAPFTPGKYEKNTAQQIVSHGSENTFYYFETSVMTKQGEFAVIKLLDKDKMLVTWLNAK